MLVHCRATPCIKFDSTHLYTWVERGTMRVKCLAQKQNLTTWSRVQCTHHLATVPAIPINITGIKVNSILALLNIKTLGTLMGRGPTINITNRPGRHSAHQANSPWVREIGILLWCSYLSLYGRHTRGNSWSPGIDDVRWLRSKEKLKQSFINCCLWKNKIFETWAVTNLLEKCWKPQWDLVKWHK